MIVVSDTTPLNYLILINRIEILRSLYNEVVIPPAVLNELQAHGTPLSVIEWTQHLPNWIIVGRLKRSTVIQHEIEEGEAEAIALAQQLQADLILLDDRRAREFAESQSLKVVGTLGVMVEASRRGLIDFRAAIQELKKTNFRLSQEVLDSALEQLREPKTRE